MTLIEPVLCLFGLLLHLLLLLELLADEEVLERDLGNLCLFALSRLLVPIQLLLLELIVVEGLVVPRLEELKVLVLVAKYQIGDHFLLPEGILHFLLRSGSLRALRLCARTRASNLLVTFRGLVRLNLLALLALFGWVVAARRGAAACCLVL